MREMRVACKRASDPRVTTYPRSEELPRSGKSEEPITRKGLCSLHFALENFEIPGRRAESKREERDFMLNNLGP